MNHELWRTLYKDPGFKERFKEYRERDFLPEDDPNGNLNPWLSVNIPWIPGHIVHNLVAEPRPGTGPESTGETHTASKVLSTLEHGGPNTTVVWRPPVGNSRDWRKPNLDKLVKPSRARVRTHKLKDGTMLVWVHSEVDWAALFEKKPDPITMRTVTMKEREELIRSDKDGDDHPYQSRFLNPVAHDAHNALKRPPYRIYIRTLLQLYMDHTGVGVVYPYTSLFPWPHQQTRLHQEAQRAGVRIKIQKLDGAHCLVTVVEKLTNYLEADDRRVFERKQDQEDLYDDVQKHLKSEAKPGEFLIVYDTEDGKLI